MRSHPFVVSRHAVLAGGTVFALAVLATYSSNSVSQEASPAASGGVSAGSGSAKSLPKNTVAPTKLDSRLGSGQADGVSPRTVVHYQGEATINAALTRVVVISTGQADAVLTLGMCPISPTTASGTEDPVSQHLRDAYPDQVSVIKAITGVESRSELDIEAAGALRPDLILVSIAGRDDADILCRSLTAIASIVVMRDTGRFWKTDSLLLTNALGKRKAAQSLLDTLKKEAAEASSALSSAGTISLLRKNGDKLWIFGLISFAGSVVADMGLQHPDIQQFTNGVSNELSFEILDQADGGWLSYGIQGDKDEKLTRQVLRGLLRAVSAGHVVKISDDLFFLNVGSIAVCTVRNQIVKAVRG